MSIENRLKKLFAERRVKRVEEQIESCYSTMSVEAKCMTDAEALKMTETINKLEMLLKIEKAVLESFS